MLFLSLDNQVINVQMYKQCTECVTDSGTLKCLCKDGYYVNSGSVCIASKLIISCSLQVRNKNGRNGFIY